MGIFPEAGRPLVIAHRGASAHALENTVAAVALAGEHGADGVEIDARLTRDGVLVAHHDDRIPGLGPVAELTLEEATAGFPRLATFDEILPEIGDLIINVEIKNHPRDAGFDPEHGIAGVVTDWIGRNSLLDRAMVSSFNPGTIALVRSLESRMTTGLLFEHGLGLAEGIPAAGAAGHDWVLPRWGAIRFRPETWARRSRAADVLIGTWTVDGAAALRKVEKAGLDAVITNDPRRARQIYG